MTIIELKEYLEKIIDKGDIDKNIPVKFRDGSGDLKDIDYFVISNDKKCLICDQEWF